MPPFVWCCLRTGPGETNDDGTGDRGRRGWWGRGGGGVGSAVSGFTYTNRSLNVVVEVVDAIACLRVVVAVVVVVPGGFVFILCCWCYC